jgi:hypothetical protein
MDYWKIQGGAGKEVVRIAPLYLSLLALGGSVSAALGAAPAAASTVYPPVPVLSVYQPKNAHDPFLRPGQEALRATSGDGFASSKVSVSAFRLEFILHDARNPSAMVNGQEMFLNKITTVQTAVGTFRVNPVEIQADRIVLEVEGQRVDLRLEEPSPTASPKPKSKGINAGGLRPANQTAQEKNHETNDS